MINLCHIKYLNQQRNQFTYQILLFHYHINPTTMSLNDSIKKYSLKHVHCPHGAMHSGQVMNMVCVDSSCSHRGLICPICRMDHHQTHQILPIKTFLQQIRSMFSQSDNNDQLNNLSDYLRALQTSKKEIISTLRGEVVKLANSFKALQEKIEQNFSAVRRNVLIQSSITTKLPSLLTLLTEESSNKDEESIRQQFKKYTELLKYENQKLKVSDKAKALVQSYSSVPSKLQSLLSAHSEEFTKKLQTLPRLFEEKQKVSQVEESVAKYTFSTENKYFDIVIEENNKVAKTSEATEEGGYVFVSQNKGAQKQKIVLEIVSNFSNSISVGLGDVDEFRNICSFISDGSMDEKADTYEFVYSNGYKKQPLQDDEQDEPLQQQVSGPPFITGDIVEIEYNGSQIIYLNRMTQEKFNKTPKFSQKTKANLQFVVGLSQNDCVKILDE